MKKTLAIVLSLILAVCMAVPVFADTTSVYTADLKGKTDVLAGLTSVKLVSPAAVLSSGQFNTYTDPSSGIKQPISLTDGVIYSDVGTSKAGASGTTVYLNKAAFKNYDTATELESNGIGAYTFDTATGSTGTYYYYIEVSEINNAKVDEFAIYYTTNTASASNNYEVPFAHIDGSFDILISCDGGKTYEKAWSSVEFKVDKTLPNSSSVLQAAGMSKESGKGNATIVTEKGGLEGNGGTKSTYAVINEKLNKTYENVTNLVYAVTGLRRKDMNNQNTAMYYAGRLSEIDLYQAEETQPNPGTADTTFYYVAAATIVAGAVLTICKKRKEN